MDICDRLEEQEADALAEVKRLRKALITMRDECNGFHDLGMRLHDFMRKERIQ